MKFKNYLMEEKIDNKDLKDIAKLIKKPTKTTIILKSYSHDYDEGEREMNVRKIPNGIELSYNADFYDLTNTLVDICDGSGYEFKTDLEKSINIMNFIIISK
uniref:Uncharacterized protein n=1 Tax=viral metagenome TaxID=1070528 RepID=A0A6M3IS48_9ZZZZ